MTIDDALAHRVRAHARRLAAATTPVSLDEVVVPRPVRAVRARRGRALVSAAIAMVVVIGASAAVLVARGSGTNSARTNRATQPMANGPLAGRGSFTSVSTGTKLIVWGGATLKNHPFGDGALYDPVTNRWHPMARSPLAARQGATAVWTGHAMFVWGGLDPVHDRWFRDGALYDPATDRWTKIAAAPIAGRELASAVWTGREVVVFGGTVSAGSRGAGTDIGDGARFDPATNTWHRLAPAPIPLPEAAGLVWTGSEVIVVSGAGVPGAAVPVAAYRPATNSWTKLPTAPNGGQLAWTGHALLLLNEFERANTAPGSPIHVVHSLALIPGQDAWRQLADAPKVIDSQLGTTATWTGSIALLPGTTTSLAYDPATNSWLRLPAVHTYVRGDPAVAWVAGRLVVWGGLTRDPPQIVSGSGVLYSPSLPVRTEGDAGVDHAPTVTAATPESQIVAVIGPGKTVGYIDRSKPLPDSRWNPPLYEVHNAGGSLIGYFSCHFFTTTAITSGAATPASCRSR